MKEAFLFKIESRKRVTVPISRKRELQPIWWARGLLILVVEDSQEGFPRVAAFLDSDASFTIYRRFGFLYARLLLYKQDELTELEEELRDMDKRDWDDASYQDCLKSRTKDDAAKNQPGRSSRKELLQRIEKKTLEYGELLRQSKELVSWNTPSTRDYASVVNWMDTEAPLFEAESAFIKEKEDLITLRPGREHAWLDAFIERTLQAFHCRFIQVGASSSCCSIPKLILHCSTSFAPKYRSPRRPQVHASLGRIKI